MKLSLEQLYLSTHDTHFLHPQSYIEGLIVGVCASPEIPLPDVWLPWTISQHAQVENNKQADRIFEALFDYFRQVLSQMKQNQSLLPDYVHEHDLCDNQAMHLFFSGLLAAHHASEQTWQQAWDKVSLKHEDKMQAMAQQLQHCLMMFTTFAQPKTAIKRAEKQNKPDFIDKLPVIARSLPQALQKYVDLSGQLVEFLPEQFESYHQ